MTWRVRWEALRESPEDRAYVLAEEAKHALAVNVYKLRKKRGLSQAALAELIGTKQPNISDIETGDANVTLETLGKLAAALGVTVADLLVDSDSHHHFGAAVSLADTPAWLSRRVQLIGVRFAHWFFPRLDLSEGLVCTFVSHTEIAPPRRASAAERAWS